MKEQEFAQEEVRRRNKRRKRYKNRNLKDRTNKNMKECLRSVKIILKESQIEKKRVNYVDINHFDV